MPALLQTVISTIFVLGLVVTIHVLGHFLAAKACGVAIDSFAINFGRAIVSWKDRSGVRWQIGWIPLGGYVRFAGDASAASVPDYEDLKALRRKVLAEEGPVALGRYFHFKPVWQRAIVVAAGPVANFVLSIVLFAALMLTMGENLLAPRVGLVEPGTPAAQAGFQVGDLVQAMDGKPVDDFGDMHEYVTLRTGLPIQFLVLRAGRQLTLSATPVIAKFDTPMGKQAGGKLGIGPSRNPRDFTHKRYGPIEALAGGAARTWDTLHTTLFVIGRLVHGQVPVDQLSGPLGIAQMSGAVAHSGAEGATSTWQAFLGSMVGLLSLAAVLSVSIGFMNLLPIPVLDGGHLLFYAYEALARRPVGARVQAAGYRVGLALLLGLMLFATWNDLQRNRVFQFLGGFFS
jgi:regulator of sigma E protease